MLVANDEGVENIEEPERRILVYQSTRNLGYITGSVNISVSWIWQPS